MLTLMMLFWIGTKFDAPPGIGFAGGSAWYSKLSNLAGVCLKQVLIYKKHIDGHCV